MIEVYEKGKKKDRTLGFIDGKKYLTRKKKLWGYLEGNVAKHENNYPLLYLKEDGKITLNEDWEYYEQGYIKNGEIRYSGSDELILSLHKDKGEVHHHGSNSITYLRGEGIKDLTDEDFFGMSAILFELFSGPPEEKTGAGEIIGDILDDIGDFFD